MQIMYLLHSFVVKEAYLNFLKKILFEKVSVCERGQGVGWGAEGGGETL